MEILTEHQGDYSITTDSAKLDLPFIHRFLSHEAYWSRNIPFVVGQAAANNSLNFGVFHNDRQIGYANICANKLKRTHS